MPVDELHGQVNSTPWPYYTRKGPHSQQSRDSLTSLATQVLPLADSMISGSYRGWPCRLLAGQLYVCQWNSWVWLQRWHQMFGVSSNDKGMHWHKLLGLSVSTLKSKTTGHAADLWWATFRGKIQLLRLHKAMMWPSLWMSNRASILMSFLGVNQTGWGCRPLWC